MGSGSVDPHIFVDPISQNIADPINPDLNPKHSIIKQPPCHMPNLQQDLLIHITFLSE